ncbi:MAG: TRAP transporter large permease subunit [Alphaproteobacteria bacterium]|nr:TRAP transporter large permease subunit [Alphaproteobacteria bacterium]
MLTTGDIVSIVFFLSTILILLTGLPVAFSLAGLSLVFAFLGHMLGVFDYSTLINLPLRYFGVMSNEVLVAVPLFVLMGNVLQRSGVAEDLLTAMGKLFGMRSGGLGFSVILVGGLLAAATGVVGATVATMALIALPAMLRVGYQPRLATGVIAASSTLAQIIPPSTILIFTADILSGVNQAAQMRLGNFAPTTLSTGDLFAGALVPGLLLVTLFMLFMAVKALVQPDTCPPIDIPEAERKGLPLAVAKAVVPPLLLIIAVLGSILGGIATPTESASIGVFGALLLTWAKGRLSWEMVREAGKGTAVTTAMIFAIVLAASLFSLTFRGLGGEHMVEEALANMPGGVVGAVLIVMAVMFVLGFFLDTFEIILIMLPICGGPLIVLGVDPIWLGVMVALNLQTSFMTPPFGFTLFYLRGFAPPSVETIEIWKGALPFVGIQIVALVLVWVFPQLATWLPGLLFR